MFVSCTKAQGFILIHFRSEKFTIKYHKSKSKSPKSANSSKLSFLLLFVSFLSPKSTSSRLKSENSSRLSLFYYFAFISYYFYVYY